MVAFLRNEAGRDPYSKDLTDLVGELSTRSEEFRALRAAHNMRLHRTGLKHFRQAAEIGHANGNSDLELMAMHAVGQARLLVNVVVADGEPG